MGHLAEEEKQLLVSVIAARDGYVPIAHDEILDCSTVEEIDFLLFNQQNLVDKIKGALDIARMRGCPSAVSMLSPAYLADLRLIQALRDRRQELSASMQF